MTTVSVITPWRGHVELYPAYREALWAATPDEVVIVDDGSDPPLEFADVSLSPSVGFARACNAGLRAATQDAVLFLNNDIELSPWRVEDWLAPIRNELRPGVLVGANVRRDAHTMVDGEVIPYLDGWCLGGMRDELAELGGWPENLEEPSYYGDNILCMTARAAGMRLVKVRVALRHLENVTTHSLLAREEVDAVTRRNQVTYADHVRAVKASLA